MIKKLYKCLHCKERKRTTISHKSCPDLSCLAKEAIRQLEIKKLKRSKEEKAVIDSWRPTAKAKDYKKGFQTEINKMARLIDSYFRYKNCICCRRLLSKQVDGAHYHGVGGNHSLRYNLHVIHSSTNFCNVHSDKHKEGYKKGLEKRYGKEYMEMVEGLVLKYPYIKVTEMEIFEKLPLVRRINRNIEMFMMKDSVSTREFLNHEIGIYN